MRCKDGEVVWIGQGHREVRKSLQQYRNRHDLQAPFRVGNKLA